MYDTIKGRLPIEKISIDDKNRLIYLLENVSNIENKFGTCFKGNFHGLNLRVSQNLLHIEGSLSKFVYGNNLESLSRSSAKLAIENLMDSLKINLSDMNLTRIDVAQNLIMQHPVEVYYTHLGELRYYKRIPVDKGLYYKRNTQQLLFYGKLTEYKDKKIAVPSKFVGLNILRYEYRITQRLTKVLNRNEVKLINIYEEDFYNQIAHLWYISYLNINKINDIIVQPTKSAKQLEINMAALGINSFGQDRCLQLIKEWQILNYINKKQAFEMRKKIKDLNEIIAFNEKSMLIVELDEKIKIGLEIINSKI